MAHRSDWIRAKKTSRQNQKRASRAMGCTLAQEYFEPPHCNASNREAAEPARAVIDNRLRSVCNRPVLRLD
jgi:hypothetical protein